MADEQLQVSDKEEISGAEGEFTREGVYFTPPVDICEMEKEIVILADMPGVKSDGVDIELKEGILSIEGNIAASDVAGEELLTEYQKGNYFRSFRITDAVDGNKIAASLADGVLKVTLPKAEKAMPKKIPITTG
ncbi:MAG: Hsp20/alpha crystallin family protein [Deltaproteobacteria bacterium]